ncbi:MAG: amidohydrolase [Lentisphaeria bacterium]|nr:amidohydrolase [Lentisphaeria bacterium]
MFTLNSIYEYIAARRADLEVLARDIWEHPETAFKEKYSAERLARFLEERDFAVTRAWLDVPTAFTTDFANGDGPVFGIAAEYDALPAVGHGCGHNLIATAAVAATLAVREAMREASIPGTIRLLGTPAEEDGGGKVVLLERGALEGVDAVMMVHPNWRTIYEMGSSALRKYDVIFHGREAHAAGNLDLAVNALDAVMLLYAGINAFRQQLPASCRIHGIVDDGGRAPNVIPGRASCAFYLRSATEEGMEKLDARFRAIAKGAAMMTGAELELVQPSKPYRSRKPNAPMNEQYLADMEELGAAPARGPSGNMGSSDFGDFSQALPGVHGYFGIADHRIPGHSREFAAAARTGSALESALRAAAAMAHIALKFMTEPEFRSRVREDFARKS